MRIHRPVVLCLLFAAFAAAGYFVARTAGTGAQTVSKPATPPLDPFAGLDTTPRPNGSGDRPEVKIRLDSEALEKGAIAGQRSLVFADRESMERFLAKIKGKGFAVLGRIDALNALRIGFLSAADLAALLDGTENTGFIFPVVVPELPDGTVQPGAVPLGNGLATWLGVSS